MEIKTTKILVDKDKGDKKGEKIDRDMLLKMYTQSLGKEWWEYGDWDDMRSDPGLVEFYENIRKETTMMLVEIPVELVDFIEYEWWDRDETIRIIYNDAYADLMHDVATVGEFTNELEKRYKKIKYLRENFDWTQLKKTRE